MSTLILTCVLGLVTANDANVSVVQTKQISLPESAAKQLGLDAENLDDPKWRNKRNSLCRKLTKQKVELSWVERKHM